MVNPLALPVLISQIPHVQKLQDAVQTHPEIAQTQAAIVAAEEQKRVRDQVPEAEKGQAMSSISPEAHDQSPNDAPRRRKKKTSPEQTDESPLGNDPSSGLIVDMKI